MNHGPRRSKINKAGCTVLFKAELPSDWLAAAIRDHRHTHSSCLVSRMGIVFFLRNTSTLESHESKTEKPAEIWTKLSAVISVKVLESVGFKGWHSCKFLVTPCLFWCYTIIRKLVVNLDKKTCNLTIIMKILSVSCFFLWNRLSFYLSEWSLLKNTNLF